MSISTTSDQAAPPAGAGGVPEAPHPQLWSAARGMCRIFTTVLFDLKVHGLHNVPRRGGVLLISNHQSNLDPILLGAQLPRPASFMAKTELFENRWFGALIRQFNAFAVRRGEADVGAIKEALRRIKEGKILTLFPEGTRSRAGELGPIQPGIAMIVRRAGVPVVPAVIDGAIQAWPRGAKLFRPHPIRVMFGPPMHVEGLKGGQIVELIGTTLRRMLEQLRQGPTCA